jgi:hypothetical protein
VTERFVDRQRPAPEALDPEGEVAPDDTEEVLEARWEELAEDGG